MEENPSGSTILIVDDELVVRQVLEATLAAEGYVVVTAASGAEALIKTAEFVPDLILLDIKMPGLDGLETCRWLRADPNLLQVPIIMVTSLSDRESRLQGFEAGADDYVSKPFDRIELLMRVRSITHLSRYRRLLAEQASREMAEKTLRRSFEKAARGQRLLLALSQAAQAVQHAHTPEEVYRTIGDEIVGLGYHAMILTLTGDGNYLTIAHLTFEAALLRAAESLVGFSAQGYRFPLEAGSFCQRVVAEGKAALSDPGAGFVAEALPESMRPLAENLADMLGAAKIICAPLQVDGEMLGLLAVAGADLTEDDVPAMAAFAGQAAIAIQNARLYQAAQQEIASRRQAEESLRESEERYRTLFENAIVGIYRTTPDGQVLAANPALIQMLGYESFDDLAALNLEQGGFTATQPRQLFKELIERAGEITGLEYMWMRRDGSVIFVRESARAGHGQDGEIIYYEGVIEDITERKQAESALRRSEQKFRSVVEQASDGIVLTDDQGAIVDWNQSQERITGLKREDAIGLPFWDVHFQLIPRDRNSEPFREMIRASQREFYRTGQAFWLNQPIDYDILRPDGTRRIIQTVAFPIQIESGFAIGSVTRDITDQVRAQEETRRRYRELMALNEVGQAIISTLDLREALTLIADHTTQLLGTQATSVLLRDEEHDDLYFAAGSGLGTDFVLGQRLPLGRGVAGWVVERDESALVPDVAQDPRWFGAFDKDGGFTTHSILCVPLRSKGRVIGAIEAINKESGFSQDDLHLLNALVAPVSTAIENARLFEQVRHGREQLQALSRRLVEVQEAERGFIARELHDETGQALSSLLLNMSLLEQQEGCSQEVKARIVQMEMLVDGMLENLHRLAMNLRPATLDHLGLLPALEQYVETFGEQYRITTQFESVGLDSGRLSPEVETTIYRIAQEALTNVSRHAEATHVDVLLERRGDVVVAIIEDNGIGFDLEAAKQSGRLGLFGMQERAEMLGGRLVIESAAGAGTTVFVEVPYAYPDPDRG